MRDSVAPFFRKCFYKKKYVYTITTSADDFDWTKKSSRTRVSRRRSAILVCNCINIFFVTYENQLYEWISKLNDRHVYKKKRNIVWTLEQIHILKRVDNPISRAVDFWLTSLLEGFITKFAVDQRKSFSEVERYFFKGYHGKYLNSLNLSLKMLLHEK